VVFPPPKGAGGLAVDEQLAVVSNNEPAKKPPSSKCSENLFIVAEGS
jgi:hypothetical protein